MNSNGRHFLTFKFLLLGGLLACFSAATASANPTPVYQGKFSLPFQALWGDTVLEPGEYSFTIDSVRSNSLTLHRESGARSVMPRPISKRAPVGQSELIVREDGGKRRIEAIQVSELGLVLYYGQKGKEKVTGDTKRTEHVPISSVPFGACPENCLG